MLLKKAKMNRSKFLPLRPAKPVFRNPTHHSELMKAAGWKSDCLYVPLHHFRTTAPVPLKKNLFDPPEILFQQYRSNSARGAAVIHFASRLVEARGQPANAA
jgi:hypothetical protein